MDHFHILDAYRSNKGLVPLKGDYTTENVIEAAHRTFSRYIMAKKAKTRQLTMIVSIYLLFSIIGIALIANVLWGNNEMKLYNKMAYVAIVISLFIISGILLFVLMFEKKWYDVQLTTQTFNSLYKIDENTIYGKVKDFKDALTDGEDVDVSTEFSQSEIDYLAGLIRRGMLYTLSEHASEYLEGGINILRDFIGAESYRDTKSTDYEDAIDTVIVPKLVESRLSVVKRSEGTKTTVNVSGSDDIPEGVCVDDCKDVTDTIKALLKSDESVSGGMIDDAWGRCPMEMKKLCESQALTGGQRCALGCSKQGNEVKPETFTVSVKGWRPSSGWASKEIDDSTANSPADACFRFADDDENVDAAYYDSGEGKCYIHSSVSTERGEWTRSESGSGRLMYKGKHNVAIPEFSSNHVADDIARALEIMNISFDISNYDNQLYERLKSVDTNFEENRPFYEEVYGILRDKLVPTSEPSAMLVPDMEHIQGQLESMNGVQFREKLVWPLTRAYTVVKIRMYRDDNQPVYVPKTRKAKINEDHALRQTMIVTGSIATFIMYYIASFELLAQSKAERVTMMSVFRCNISRHIVFMSFLTLFWGLVTSTYWRKHVRNVFNEETRLANTDEFLETFDQLRNMLHAASGDFAALDPSSDDADADAVKRDFELMLTGVHSSDMTTIGTIGGSAPVSEYFDIEKRLEVIKLARKTIRAYDKCNLVKTKNNVPFPMPEFSIYTCALVIMVSGIIYLHKQFNISEVAKRVSRVSMLQKKIMMGDTNAAMETAGIVTCVDRWSETWLESLKHLGVGLVAVVGVVFTIVLVNGNDEYVSSIRSGAMRLRGKCVR